MRSPDVISAEMLEDYEISITFSNGEVRHFDLKPYLKYPIFRPLNDKEAFNSYHIVDGTIEWSCGADLSPDTFYLESRLVNNDVMV